MYVIYKNRRIPTAVSYNGSTWDEAGIRQHYQAQYESKAWAEILAESLSKCNPVGFSVAEI